MRSDDRILGKHFDEDNLSSNSLGSQISVNSHVSSLLGTFDVINRTDESLPEIEILTDPEIDIIKIESQPKNIFEIEKNSSQSTIVDPNGELFSEKEIFIGNIYDQTLIHYTVRLVASKFLLAGIPNEVLSDRLVRVSIKNLALMVVANCVDICPEILLLSIEFDGSINLEEPLRSDDDSSENMDEPSNITIVHESVDNPNAEKDNENTLDIKDDHFGESHPISKTYFDFMSPLSKSADNVLLSQLKKTDHDIIGKRSRKLNTDLTDMLSKSDIVESNSSFEIGAPNFISTPTTSSKVSLNKKLGEKNAEKRVVKKLTAHTVDRQQQLIEDVLLFHKHTDPILRANAILVAGNFIATVLGEFNDLTQFLVHHLFVEEDKFLNFVDLNILLEILLKVS